MKTKLFALALAFAAVLAPPATRAEDEIDFNFFYENLSPYGEWIEVGDYGNCWVPSDVDDEWSPYTDGYWSYTDAGWTWISYEDFGDITYHYGRWVRADDVGWCWVPDYEWGPAWVSWREEDEHIGWAPLPPEARWNVNVGFSTWVDDTCDIGPTYYNFVPVIHFGAPVIRYHCVPRVTVIHIFHRTRNITNICWEPRNRFVFCGGPRYAYYNARLARPIPTLKIVNNNIVNNYNTTIINNKKVVKVVNKVEGNTLRVFSPKVAKKTTNQLIQPTVTRVVAKDKVNKGWRPGAKDKEKGVEETQLTKLREKVREEAKTTNPEKAPARPVEVADLEPVPKKADPKAKSPVADRVRPAKDKVAGDKPGKVADERPNRGPGNDKPNQPDTGTEKPNKVADERPNRGNDKPNKMADERPNKGQGGDDKPNRPQAGVGEDKPNKVAGDRPNNDNPLKKPFREQGGQPENKVKPQADNDGPNKLRDADGEQRQRMAREQQEKQLNAQREAQQRQRAQQMENERQRNAVNEAKQRRAQEVQAENAQRQRAQQQQAVQAQRQQQMQRQAEMQQRQMQAQREQQMQRQQQQFRQQQPQGGGGQRQGGGQGQGKGKGQLSEEELRQLRKQQR